MLQAQPQSLESRCTVTEKNDKITYVSLYGIEKAHSDVKQYSEKALSIFDTLEVKNEFLYTLTEKLINRRK